MDDKTEVLEAVVKEAVDLVPKQSNPSLWFFFFFFFLKLCLRTILSVLSFAFWCICFLGLGFLVGLCGIFTLFGIFCCWVWDELYFKYGFFILFFFYFMDWTFIAGERTNWRGFSDLEMQQRWSHNSGCSGKVGHFWLQQAWREKGTLFCIYIFLLSVCL